MDEYPSKNTKYWKRCQRRAHAFQIALRVIETWAQYDLDNLHGPRALCPNHVIELIDKTLGGEHGRKD